MTRIHPQRLMNEHFLSLSSPFRIDEHRLVTHVDEHWHEFFELALVVEGTGTHRLNGFEYRMRQGSLFWLTPADFHAITPDSHTTIRLYNVIFTEQFLRPAFYDWLLQQTREPMVQLETPDFRLFESEFSRMWTESHQWQADSEFVMQGALERVLIDFMRRCVTRVPSLHTGGDRIHPSIRKSVSYIHHHFRDPITLEQVASQVGLSANYFSDCFRKQVGATFQIYLLDRRLQFAKSLLCISTLPITEVSDASGFGTLNYFERAFKRKYGQTPRQVRERQNR